MLMQKQLILWHTQELLDNEISRWLINTILKIVNNIKANFITYLISKSFKGIIIEIIKKVKNENNCYNSYVFGNLLLSSFMSALEFGDKELDKPNDEYGGVMCLIKK